MSQHFRFCSLLFFSTFALFASDTPSLILHHGKIATVDKDFTLGEAIAIRGEKIVAVGSNKRILGLKNAGTTLIDLKGRLVLPGLIDSHVHPAAAMTEFDHPIPEMDSISQVLDYIRDRTGNVPAGEWIVLRQIFITRLREQRYPTRAELDQVAPKHPVMFSTGPDAVLNSLALKEAGFDENFSVRDGGPGYLEKEPGTGKITGVARGLGRLIQPRTTARTATEEQTRERTLQLFRDYNSVGLTTVADRNASPESLGRYHFLRTNQQLSLRLFLYHSLAALGPIEEIESRIASIGSHPLHQPDPFLQIIGVKTFLDGGMLTGSAYMREPWGVSSIYGITDPQYRGVLNIPAERLEKIVRAATRHGLQFTAHSVGDGAVHLLLDTYRKISSEIRPLRPSFTHCNFMSAEAISGIREIGGVIDIQPAWLYLDTRTLEKQFGYDRLRYFQPLRSLFAAGVPVGGGSDHMQKIGSFRSINPYNPFLGMHTAITRRARWHKDRLHPEEALSREQAIRFYTANNAYILFQEKNIGSLEPGKFADLVVLDRDLLKCPLDSIPQTKVLQTYSNGRLVYGETKLR